MSRLPVTWLTPGHPEEPFPPLESALDAPNGLLAAGGDLAIPRLLRAYREGIFPWYEDGQPILWWSPDPRTVLFTDRVKVSRSLGKTLRSGRFQVSLDTCFDRVIEACAGPRRGSHGTWITPELRQAFCALHKSGHAHSVEVWRDGHLVGGLYGLAIGRMFFGESMFSHVPDASKVTLVTLCRHLAERGVPLIDCQTRTPHLIGMGAECIPRGRFRELLDLLCPLPCTEGTWRTSA